MSIQNIINLLHRFWSNCHLRTMVLLFKHNNATMNNNLEIPIDKILM